MTLGEVIETITAAEQEGKMTVRLHTGDPAIYGAIQEQMDELSRRNIEYTVIPGVSSFLATAAALKQEYTLPEISQTVIITRNEGRTPVPEKEKIKIFSSSSSYYVHFLECAYDF